MKLFVMTDLEGVAGVINGGDYLIPSGRYYETGRRLLTLEVNAAIEGFASAGFDEFLVVDGHGEGAINIELLDPRARLGRGMPTGSAAPHGPWGINASFDAMAVVGQHAKAGTPMSHLTHTGWWNALDISINGVSVGEYGELALIAGDCGVPVIFASGEKALCDEVRALTPWVTTVSVLEGTIPGTGDDLSGEDYEKFHEGAIHLHPEVSRRIIREGAMQAAQSFHSNRDLFLPLRMKPPHRIVSRMRSYRGREAATVSFEFSGPVADALVERMARLMEHYNKCGD